jgi:hypothetical protein
MAYPIDVSVWMRSGSAPSGCRKIGRDDSVSSPRIDTDMRLAMDSGVDSGRARR